MTRALVFKDGVLVSDRPNPHPHGRGEGAGRAAREEAAFA